MFKLTALITGLMLVNSLFAATIAVIDSGTDVQHKDLAPFVWTNSNEIPDNNRDEDRNGYQDDVYGWNFAENNNLVIDYKYLGTFSEDVYTFFELQFLAMLGTISEEELNWLRAKVQDQDFIKELTVFGNFVHGTHVTGIAINGVQNSKVLSIKLMPTEVALPGGDDDEKSMNKDFRMSLVKKALEELAKAQMSSMVDISAYIKGHGVDVANCSFGTNMVQASMIATYAFKGIFWREPTEEELQEVALHFLNSVLIAGRAMLEESPNTLFVVAAGNDGTNNDELPVSPANIVGDNKITVAATYKRQVIAPFSNYGIENVDIAAPGMGINSTIPGDQYLVVSGTSQAAPYVTRVAAQVKEANPALTPFEVKQILMGTVDLKDYLAEKVKSGGIVNAERATEAARLALTESVEDAINHSFSKVSDVPGEKSRPGSDLYLDFVLPLPSTFKF